MKTLHYATLSSEDRTALLRRPFQEDRQALEVARTIFESVSREGDKALRSLTMSIDGIDRPNVRLSSEEQRAAVQDLSPSLHSAIDAAAQNIKHFHRTQVPHSSVVETAPGVVCRREWRPISTVGLYVPGGTAPLLSTVLMLGIPARLAGCHRVILCTPPRPGGSPAPEVIAAAAHLKIGEIFAVGGAQAIAAMAIGTQSVPKVDKIFGPGNRYVAAAKSLASLPPYNTGIDLPAGPSELLVIADDSADPRLVAADLLSQAEHGEGSQVVLISTSPSLLDSVRRECDRQLDALPRKDSVRRMWDASFALLVPALDDAIAFSNDYAPEHLQLAVASPERYSGLIRNAGSVFLGPGTSVVYGDYASGTNHTLPTGGSARFSGGLTVESFMKPVSFQYVNPEGQSALRPVVAALARAEGLEAHARAAEARCR